jgi:hypothetical protein
VNFKPNLVNTAAPVQTTDAKTRRLAPNPPQIVGQFVGKDFEHCVGEYLLTEWSDGKREVAWRQYAWETWSPPMKLTAVPL